MTIPETIQPEQIINSIADGLFIINTDYTVIAINKAALDILSLEESEAVGQKCYEIFHASVCEGMCPLKEAFACKEPVRRENMYIVTATGSTVPLSVTSSVLCGPDGKVQAGVEIFRDMTLVETLRKEITHSYTVEDIVSKNARMHELFGILPDIAASDSTVLLQGESGTGKELFARALHNLSCRREKPFVVVNAGAIPEQLLESELFGYVKGAFTGAVKNRQGRVEAAEGGTLFLDEIGDIPFALQVKLLRFIQFKEYERLGSNEVRTADVRIISASNRDLFTISQEGVFRQDLYYRLSVITLELPPLRDRKDDIPLLIDQFICHFNYTKSRQITGAAPSVVAQLMEYEYPGNVRELRNIIEYAFALCRSAVIESRDLPRQFHTGKTVTSPTLTLAELERLHIEQVLTRNDGNRKKSAEELGINQSTLWRKLQAD